MAIILELFWFLSLPIQTCSFPHCLQLLWILIIRLIPDVGLWVQVNHEIKCLSNENFSIGLYADFSKTTKLDTCIDKHASYPLSMKIGTHKN